MIGASELIINKDGTIFHLHLKPENLAQKVILVGDPGRVEMIASMFTNIECRIQNREFFTVTGSFNHQRVTVLSTGIGTDNIDIVLNELDALANIDFKSKTPKPVLTSLDIIRIGTSGALQHDIPVNSFVVSEKSIGFDGLLNFYAGRDSVCDLEFEDHFKKLMNWHPNLPAPYVTNGSVILLKRFNTPEFIHGVNISAPGFYGPQGRVVRLPLAFPEINELIENFRYKSFRITNYEMESSAIYGLSALLGHQALTVCAIIANRVTLDANNAYHPMVEKLVSLALNKFVI